MNTIVDRLQNDGQAASRLSVFYQYLNGTLLLIIILKFFGIGGVFGESAVFPQYPYERGGLQELFLVLTSHPEWVFFFQFGLIGALIVLMFKPHWSMAALAYFLHLNIYHHAYIGLNSGYLLVNIFLLFNAIRLAFPSKSKHHHLVNTVIWYGLCAQVCLVYFVSFLHKIEGDVWPSGMALEAMAGNQVFGHSILLSFPSWLLKVLTYFVLIHQATFPVLVWIKKSRPLVLIGGIAIHLGIMVFMGLFDFGLIMIVSYLLFVQKNPLESWFKRILQNLVRKRI